MMDDPRVEPVARELAPGLNWKNDFDGHLKRVVRQKARAAPAAADRAAWRDISEAPKDGTRVLVVTRQHKDGVEIACWDDGRWRSDDGYNPLPYGWQPLPAPPEDT